MRLLLLFLLFSCLNIYSQDKSQVVGLEYFNGIQLDSINEPGKQRLFKQLCTNEIDSMIHSGNIKFNKSSVGLIQNCGYTYQVRNDTLASIIIQTNKKGFTEQLIAQATKQYGESIQSKEGKIIHYKWSTKLSNGTVIITSMSTSKNHKKAKMVITKGLKE